MLRGCGLPALADISGAEDLQMAAAALSGSYQMALADAAAVPDLRNITAELEATVALQRETLVTAAADVSRLSAELATERRVSASAMSAVASICEHLGCDDHNGHVPVLRAIDDLRAQIASLTADVMRIFESSPKPGAFRLGDLVKKVSGSAWEGRIVGTYSTALTPEGYAVESASHPGSVQIYPAKALTLVIQEAGIQPTEGGDCK